jgi:hypothetical protein
VLYGKLEAGRAIILEYVKPEAHQTALQVFAMCAGSPDFQVVIPANSNLLIFYPRKAIYVGRR